MTAPIAFYITAHGFGHGVRSSDIIRAYKRQHPEHPAYIVSGLPAAFFQARLGDVLSPFDTIRNASFDVGMVQQDAIRTDVEATLAATLDLCHRAEELVLGEQDYLSRNGIRAVVADIPGIPLAAAKRAGIPAIAIGNFSWDWIYAEFAARDPRWQPVIEHFQGCYRQADLLLRLPFPCDTGVFRRIEDVPLLAELGRSRRDELARDFGASLEKRWVLLSFTSLQWEPGALRKLQALQDYEFFVVRPFDWPDTGLHAVEPARYPFSDVVASVDVVVSKPGFGIVSDCIANGKPLIYADRTDFAEYEVLVDAIALYLRNHHIPSSDLYAGDLLPALEHVLTAPEPAERLGRGGAGLAARRIYELAFA